MCYGQTGAGKTYTMTGTTENYKHRGILPRALQQVGGGRGGRHTGPCSATGAATPGQLLETLGDRMHGGRGVRESEASGNQESGFWTPAHAQAEPVSSFVKGGVGLADWLLAAALVCGL